MAIPNIGLELVLEEVGHRSAQVHDVPTAVLLETTMSLDMPTIIAMKQSRSNNRLFLVPSMIFRYIAHD